MSNQKGPWNKIATTTAKNQKPIRKEEKPVKMQLKTANGGGEKPPKSANKAVDDYESSSEEELQLDEEHILRSLYQHYKPKDKDEGVDQKEASPAGLAQTSSFLESLLQTGAATCLICIGGIRRADEIWSCQCCFRFFHLTCIRRWANDSIAQTSKTQPPAEGHYNHMGVFVPPKRARPQHWCCPQCRTEYAPDARPKDYTCFCGKEQNPAVQPWLVPHSCGEICAKQLKPDCGHTCMLLCHPGPCPPCAQYARTSCLCGQAPVKVVRCAEKLWQCTGRCAEVLACGVHKCGKLCHKSGECPPCGESSLKSCVCGAEKKSRKCADAPWQCKKVCDRPYACGNHKCRRVCHAGECGDCPLGQPRSCPCGKTKKSGPCSEVVDTCGDTCQKTLPCGLHTCTLRCHRGACNLCHVIIKKKCRCGLHEKELPCCKEQVCETKCKRTRDCGKHACNKKCCDGTCPPCDKVCAKALSCGKHRCQSICHEGPCYPCQQRSQINCRCGSTSRRVPCGRERSARLVCPQPCRIPSKCHHTVKHRCHKNDCPPCRESCGLPNDTTKCGHKCTAKCHDAVKVQRPPNVEVPWKTAGQTYEYRKLPHPRCEEPIPVPCIGGHRVEEWPCWDSAPKSCFYPCKRALRCGNHSCTLTCHAVPNPADMNAQEGCESCQEGCQWERPPGCVHPCNRRCHSQPCEPCQTHIRTKCHCRLSQVAFKCSEFFSTDDAEVKERLRSCGSRCLKNLLCGHRCPDVCHSGSCPTPEACRKKVRIFCLCRRLKQEVQCEKHRAGLTALPCDDLCMGKAIKEETEQQAAVERQRLKEDAKNRAEVEQFEKKFAKRRAPRERKVLVQEQKKEFNWSPILITGGVVSAVLLAVWAAVYGEN